MQKKKKQTVYFHTVKFKENDKMLILYRTSESEIF